MACRRQTASRHGPAAGRRARHLSRGAPAAEPRGDLDRVRRGLEPVDHPAALGRASTTTIRPSRIAVTERPFNTWEFGESRIPRSRRGATPAWAGSEFEQTTPTPSGFGGILVSTDRAATSWSVDAVPLEHRASSTRPACLRARDAVRAIKEAFRKRKERAGQGVRRGASRGSTALRHRCRDADRSADRQELAAAAPTRWPTADSECGASCASR